MGSTSRSMDRISGLRRDYFGGTYAAIAVSKVLLKVAARSGTIRNFKVAQVEAPGGGSTVVTLKVQPNLNGTIRTALTTACTITAAAAGGQAVDAEGKITNATAGVTAPVLDQTTPANLRFNAGDAIYADVTTAPTTSAGKMLLEVELEFDK